tara:strand:- start:17663 stop:17788 length:126 start_codon:yes stop_codon:yes gene_type:complete
MAIIEPINRFELNEYLKSPISKDTINSLENKKDSIINNNKA